jgi:predicted nucleic acid-binding protein
MIDMKPSLYVETTIPSFVVGGISPVLTTAGHQVVTRRWWEEEREKYRLFVSRVVEDEILQGKAQLAEQRIALLKSLERLVVNRDVTELAGELHSYLRLPPAAETDALHLAVACHYEIDYLLTWNMKHLANARIRRDIERFGNEQGMLIPVICTPEELAGWSDEL